MRGLSSSCGCFDDEPPFETRRLFDLTGFGFYGSSITPIAFPGLDLLALWCLSEGARGLEGKISTYSFSLLLFKNIARAGVSFTLAAALAAFDGCGSGHV